MPKWQCNNSRTVRLEEDHINVACREELNNLKTYVDSH